MGDEACSDEDDELLLLRISEEQDGGALAFLMNRHIAKLKGHLLSKFHKYLREPEIDQVINRVFMKVWRKANQYNAAKGSVGGWLIRIAQNEAISFHRAEEPHQFAGLEYDPADDSAEDCEEEAAGVETRNEWRAGQLDDIIENILKGLEQAVARADLVSGGKPDIARLAMEHKTTKNNISATKSKVRKKLERLILDREAQINRPKGRT